MTLCPNLKCIWVHMYCCVLWKLETWCWVIGNHVGDIPISEQCMTQLCQNHLIFLQYYEPTLCCCISLYDFLTNFWFYYFFCTSLDIDVWITHTNQLNIRSICSTWLMLLYLILIIIFMIFYGFYWRDT